MKYIFPTAVVFLIAQLTACSRNSADLNLECAGTISKSESFGNYRTNEKENNEFNLFFKEQRRYNPETQKFISESCQIWTDEAIKCISKGENLSIDVSVNRISGEASFNSTWSEKSNYSHINMQGKCKKIEKAKL